MKCPYCSSNTKVIDKRDSQESARRRRECLKCKKRFTTYERFESKIVIVKKDKRREPFNRDKLRQGIEKACEKRPVSQDKIEKMISDIEAKLMGHGSEVPARLIGNLVIQKLKKLDKIAYVRFASVYKDFKDVSDFRKELRGI